MGFGILRWMYRILSIWHSEYQRNAVQTPSRIVDVSSKHDISVITTHALGGPWSCKLTLALDENSSDSTDRNGRRQWSKNSS